MQIYSMAFRLSFISIFTIFLLNASVTIKVNNNTTKGAASHQNQETAAILPTAIISKRIYIIPSYNG